MNNYELLYILPSNMTGKEIKSAFGDIEKEILKMGGEKLETLLDHPFLSKTEVSKEEDTEELKNLPVVKRKLAYTIEKNRFGFYCLFNFSSEGNKLKEIDKYLKMNKNVLRHFILQADPMSKEGLAQLQKLFARKKAEQEKENKKEEAKTIEKTEKEDSKKISEIEDKKEKIIPEENIREKDKDTKGTDKKIAPEKSDEKDKEEIPEEKEEKEEESKKKKVNKKKKIKLEDLEDKLDEILDNPVI
ncbi:30S ribosomal protein S6 [Candidatus Parcubacteria bacterium]|nr:30S ribosomal protein S6 [Candidatus Parcubacteria bacterium]